MKLLILQAIISVVYIFDVSTYPFIHVPFYVLTLLYFASILEIYGIVRLTKFLSRRLSRYDRRRAIARMLITAFLHSSLHLS
jgi:hypothetical protein